MIDARKEAQSGATAHPKSEGARLCHQIIFEIEQVTYSTQAMASDASEKRSLQITYRNAQKFYLRAYAWDFEEQLKSKQDGRDFSSVDSEAARKLIRSSTKPIVEWSITTEKTSDFLDHRLYARTPKLKTGAYLILASLNEDFSRSQNQIIGSSVFISDLVTTIRAQGDGTNEIKVLSGETGQPIAGAKVTLYRYTWEKPAVATETQTTNADGLTVFNQPRLDPKVYWNSFYVTRLAGDVAPSRGSVSFLKSEEVAQTKGLFIYSDRSIYRPNQKILFKIVGYSGSPKTGRFESVKSGQSYNVRLLDPNGKVAGDMKV